MIHAPYYSTAHALCRLIQYLAIAICWLIITRHRHHTPLWPLFFQTHRHWILHSALLMMLAYLLANHA